jgi:thymidylate synthase (FAD)
MGDDLAIVNAARVSYAGESKDWSDRDEKLLRYLWDHDHTSPFRHGHVKFRIKAPIFVLRQWMKHQVGCAWNEQSARYTEIKESFFYPDHFRLQDTKNKQSSSGQLDDEREDQALSLLAESYQVAYSNYLRLLDMGVCREQARIILPVGTYSECIWSASVQAIMHFLNLRLDSHSQFEIQEFAKAVYDITKHLFPKTLELVKCNSLDVKIQ